MAAPITTGPDAYEKPYQLQKSVSAPLATAPANFPLRKVIEQHADVIAPLCPPGTNPETVIAQLYAACLRTPQIAQATPQSLIIALSVAIPTGGVIGHDVYLLPFYSKDKKAWEVSFAFDYKYLAACIVQAGGARSIDAHAVYEGDDFKPVKGTEPHIHHVEAWDKPRGRLRAFYAVAHFGQHVPPRFVVMSLAEVEKIRARSKSWSKGECPDWYGMARAVHRLGKLLPKKANPRLQQLAAIMDADERVDAAEAGEIVGEITPMPVETPADAAPVATEDVSEELAAALAYTVKGQALGDMDDERLGKLREWAEGKGNDRVVAMCRLVLADRQREAIADAFDAEEVDDDA